MGQYAVIIAAAFMGAVGIFVVSNRTDVQSADATMGRYQAKLEARDAAHTGLSLTMRKLAADPDAWADGSLYSIPDGTFERATFTSTVTPTGIPAGDTVDIVVVAAQNVIGKDGVGGDTTHTIDARVVRGLTASIPPGFRNVINTDRTLTLRGNMLVNSLDPNINASVHSNSILKDNGNSFEVHGYGTYTGSSQITQPDNFTPNVDWNGPASNVFERDSIPLPELELDRLRSQATLHEAGDFVIDGDTWPYTNFEQWSQALGLTSGTGTSEDPFILVVEGTLEFRNRVEIDGYGMLVSASDIQVNPNGNGNGIYGGIDGYYDELGIYAAGPIDVNGNAILKTIVYSADRVTFHGTPEVTGAVVAKEAKFIGAGNPIFTYVGPGFGIVKPGFSHQDAVGPVIIASAEW